VFLSQCLVVEWYRSQFTEFRQWLPISVYAGDRSVKVGHKINIFCSRLPQYNLLVASVQSNLAKGCIAAAHPPLHSPYILFNLAHAPLISPLSEGIWTPIYYKVPWPTQVCPVVWHRHRFCRFCRADGCDQHIRHGACVNMRRNDPHLAPRATMPAKHVSFRLGCGFCWPCCAFINYIYLLTLILWSDEPHPHRYGVLSIFTSSVQRLTALEADCSCFTNC